MLASWRCNNEDVNLGGGFIDDATVDDLIEGLTLFAGFK